MKVRATFQHVFEVTRVVEVDDEDYARLVRHEAIRERDISDERVLPLWIYSQDTEYLAEAFPDWKTSAPLPSDFELQYTEVTEAERVTHSAEPETRRYCGRPESEHPGGAYCPVTHSTEGDSL